MPRRYYRRKYSRKPSRRMTTFKYYKKRSSKQQAYQLARLDKRINAVYKNLGGTVERITHAAYAIAQWGSSAPTATNVNNHFNLTMMPQGQTPKEILYRGCYLNIDAAFVAPPISYAVSSTTTPTIWVRILVIQYRQAGETYSAADFITNYTSQRGIFEPLNEDSGTKAKILKDIKFRLDQRTPDKHFKLRFKRRFRIKQADGVQVQKNTIDVFTIAYNQGAESGNVATWGSQCYANITAIPYNYIIYDKQ